MEAQCRPTSDLTHALPLGFALALLSAFGASAEPEIQCAPGEASVDLSPRMPPGVSAVWVLSAVSNGRGVDFYQLGHSEKKIGLVGGVPSRMLLQGKSRVLCVSGAVQGVTIDHVEYGG